MTINKDKRIYKPFSRLCVKILPTRLLTQAQDFVKKFQRREKQEIKNQDESGYTFSGRWLRHNCIESTVRVSSLFRVLWLLFCGARFSKAFLCLVHLKNVYVVSNVSKRLFMSYYVCWKDL